LHGIAEKVKACILHGLAEEVKTCIPHGVPEGLRSTCCMELLKDKGLHAAWNF
jgi:hypothetical protein